MIPVICGLIRNSHNQYFIARRAPHKAHAGYWEFPGGKLEAGESHEACLQRELWEELGMEVRILKMAGSTIHQFPNFKIELIAYHCAFISASYTLCDHDRYEWVAPEALPNYRMMESDIAISKLLLDV